METDEIINSSNRVFAYVSHDIRMPVSGIIGMADIALKNLENNKEKTGDCLLKIIESSHYLMSLVNNVNDMFRYGIQGFGKVNKPFNMAEFLNGCIGIFEGLLYDRDLHFINKCPDLQVVKVCGDELHLKQVLINLFENSVKYTPDGGAICFDVEEVHCDRESITYCFIISDNGIGMSEEFIKEIFEPFSQENPGSNVKYSGSGLGMTVARQFTEMIGGDIKVRSRKGEGTVFKVTVTFDIDHSGVIKKSNIPAVDFAGMNILVADDSDINARVLCGLLEQKGACTYMALDGESAVGIFKKSEINFFDAVLMDVTMPVMNGLEATQLIRSLSRPDALSVPVFAMTGNVFKDDIENCKKAGMDGHITKPVNLNELAGKLESLK